MAGLRLQRLSEGFSCCRMRPAGAEIWIDGGHNPGAGEVIAEAMANFEERQSRPLFLITGMINTKDPVGYFKAFTGLVEKVFCVPIRGSEAMIDPVILSNAAYDAGLVAEPMLTVGDALEAIKAVLDPEALPPRILVGGSLYLVGDVLADNGTPPK